jgi:membrane associated rhomboid family serine protease/Zn-finger nucleic acid-binding protein
MFICPNCARALTRMQSFAGVYWACESCGGRTVAMPILRKVVGDQPITQLWAAARSGELTAKRCPTCGHGMVECSAGGIRLDVCKVCQFVWFDAREFEQMPVAAPVADKAAELPQAAREAIALYEVQRMAEAAADDGPPDSWQYVPAVFGLPVECDSPRLTRFPFATWAIALLVAVTSIAAWKTGDSISETFALVPAEAWRFGGLTLITSFFLHGGILHLASNLYFLIVFGDNAEEFLGRWRFGSLLLAATIFGGLAHIAGEPRTTIPCVGASGGISGIIAFYALQFPSAKLGLFVRAYYRLRWMQFPAWAALVFWIVLQLIGAAKQVAGFSNVSALAHLGGAAAGFVAWCAWRIRKER